MLGSHLSFSLIRRHLKVKLGSQSRIATFRRDCRVCSYQNAGSQSSCAMRGLQRPTEAYLSVEEKEVRQERLGVKEVGLRDQLAPLCLF